MLLQSDLTRRSDRASVVPLNGRLRDELLKAWQFDSLLEPRVHLGDWRLDYNCNRPHTAHGDLTPTQVSPDQIGTVGSSQVDIPIPGPPHGPGHATYHARQHDDVRNGAESRGCLHATDLGDQCEAAEVNGPRPPPITLLPAG